MNRSHSSSQASQYKNKHHRNDHIYRRLQYRKDMTICVAAIAEVFEEEPRIVFCADRMISGRVQFELGNPKIFRLNDYCLVMMAGNPLKGGQIISKVQERLLDEDLVTNEIVKIVSEEYRNTMNETNEQRILSPKKLTIKKFYSQLNKFPKEFAEDIDEQLKEDPFDLSFLVCGIDNSEAHLFEVVSKGEINDYSSLGFAAIGSGAPQSIAELGKYQYGSNISLSHAIHLTYLAKKEAQRVGGIGVETDLGVLHVVDDKTTLWMADNDFVSMLDEQISKLKGYETQLQKETEIVISEKLYKQNKEDMKNIENKVE